MKARVNIKIYYGWYKDYKNCLSELSNHGLTLESSSVFTDEVLLLFPITGPNDYEIISELAKRYFGSSFVKIDQP